MTGDELLCQERQRRGTPSLRHQQTVHEPLRVRERTPQRADHVEELVGASAGQPARPRAPGRIDDELERSRPPTATRSLVDRAVPAQHELPSLGHRDRQELTGTGPLGDLRRDERDRLIHAHLPAGQDLGAGALHADASATPAASSKLSRVWMALRRAAA